MRAACGEGSGGGGVNGRDAGDRGCHIYAHMGQHWR